jgi:hypothetical protein
VVGCLAQGPIVSAASSAVMIVGLLVALSQLGIQVDSDT